MELSVETGASQHLWSKTAVCLRRKNPQIFKRSEGYSSFGQYVTAASERGIVNVGRGKGPGFEWLELRPRYRWESEGEQTAEVQETRPEPAAASPRPALSNARQPQRTAEPRLLSAAAAELDTAAATDKSQSTTALTTVEREVPQLYFTALLEAMRQLEQETGCEQLPRALVAARLKASNPTLYDGPIKKFLVLVKEADKRGLLLRIAAADPLHSCIQRTHASHSSDDTTLQQQPQPDDVWKPQPPASEPQSTAADLDSSPQAAVERTTLALPLNEQKAEPELSASVREALPTEDAEEKDELTWPQLAEKQEHELAEEAAVEEPLHSPEQSDLLGL